MADAHDPYRARVAATLTFMLTGAVFGAWIPRLPDVKSQLHLSAGMLGLALLTPACGALLVMIPVGRLCGRIGSRRITASTFAGFCLFAAVVPWSGSFWLLAALMLPWGACIGGCDVAMNAQAVTIERRYGRPILSGFHAWFSIGGIVGAGIGSIGAAAGIGVGIQQVVVALAAAAVQGAASRALLPDAGSRAEAADGAAGGDGPKHDAARGRAVLAMLGVATIAALISEASASDWSAILLRDTLGASGGTAGLAFVAFSATMAAGRLTGDRIVARFGRPQAVVVLGGGGAAGLAAGFLLDGIGAVIGGFAVLGIGLAVMFPVAISCAAQAASAAGSGIAAVTTAGYVAFLGGPTLIGQLADHIGLRSTLWLVPGLTALAAVLISLAVAMAERVVAAGQPVRQGA